MAFSLSGKGRQGESSGTHGGEEGVGTRRLSALLTFAARSFSAGGGGAGGRPEHCGVLSSIPGPHPLHARSLPSQVLTTKMFPNITTRPLGGHIPSVENPWVGRSPSGSLLFFCFTYISFGERLGAPKMAPCPPPAKGPPGACQTLAGELTAAP